VDDGMIDVIYGFPYGGGVAIANVDSTEELNGVLMSNPAFWLNDWEIRPLMDIDTLLGNVAEGLERAVTGAPA
jgi:hypothetical protein